MIEGLEAVWVFFEGVLECLVIDNFPAAVAGPDPLHPRLTRGFLEYSQRRGFISRPGAGAPSPGQAARGAWSALRAGAVLQGRGVHRPLGQEVCGQAPAPDRGRTEGARHHPQAAPLVVFRDEERHALGEWDAGPYVPAKSGYKSLFTSVVPCLSCNGQTSYAEGR